MVDNTHAFIEKLVGEGEKFAIWGISDHIDTGETISTIRGIAYRSQNKGVIVAGGAAIWLEFGTGVVKNFEEYPHPKAEELGMSAIGTYGDGNGSNPNGWFYRDESGQVHHSNGVEATMFMYNTAKILAEKAPEYAKEVFKT